MKLDTINLTKQGRYNMTNKIKKEYKKQQRKNTKQLIGRARRLLKEEFGEDYAPTELDRVIVLEYFEDDRHYDKMVNLFGEEGFKQFLKLFREGAVI